MANARIQSQNRKKRSNETVNQSNQNTVTSISGITTNPEQFHQLKLAIEAHDYDAFKRILGTSMIGVNDLDEIGGSSLLMIASEAGCLRIVKELISRGADVDYQDSDNWTALMCATKEGRVDCANELLDAGGSVDLKDMGGWTALMWASYKGIAPIVESLLKRNATPNYFDNENHMTCLCWASGRGFKEVVPLLLAHGAKVDVGDKYGTTPLTWSSRKGYVEIVKMLLKAGANVDSVGMFGWSPLIVATRGNFTQVVELILSYRPNVNICDPQGLTPLMTACKEGNLDIVNLLLSAHSYVNMSDKNGDSALIHASKAGHTAVVEALVKAHADIDHYGMDRKTALYSAVEKGHVDVVKALLKSNPNLEIATKDIGDTPLLRSVRNRKIQLVRLLLEKKAKVSVVDREGDTVLHIAARSQSKAILELILRNPKNSQLLYKPNKRGETAFSIDSNHQKPILPTLFGAAPSSRRVLEKETQLGYDLYSSAMANLLTEPQLKTPICIGLFAKWGSGKSFLVGKLKDDLMNFTNSWSATYYHHYLANGGGGDYHPPSGSTLSGFGWTTVLAVISLSIVVGTSVLIASAGQFMTAFLSLLVTLVICYTCLGVFISCGHRFDSSPGFSSYMERLKLTLLVTFASPPRIPPEASLPVRFLFCDSAGVKVSSMTESSVSQFMSSVLDSLWEVVESEFGFFPVRLYRVFRPKHIIAPSSSRRGNGHIGWKWRKVCFMIPTIGLVMFFLIACSGLLAIYYVSLNEETSLPQSNFLMEVTTPMTGVTSPQYNSTSDISVVKESRTFIVEGKQFVSSVLSSTATAYVLVALLSVLGTWILANIIIPFKIIREVFFNPSRRNKKRRLDGPSIKKEIDLLSSCLYCFDAFDGRRQSRVALVLDTLESVYESERLVSFLEAINCHFANPSSSSTNDPFVTIVALDPHHHSTSRSKEYLRTIIHLPFYLQNSQLRRVRIAQTTAERMREIKMNGSTTSIVDALNADMKGAPSLGGGQSSGLTRSASKLSAANAVSGKKGNPHKGSLMKPAESVASLLGPTGEAPTKVLLTDDYFSDVNPKSLRRIMNIVYIQGRLLKAFNIDFNWHRLTIWVNITEQFPLRSSALIVFCEMMEGKLPDDNTSLKSLYEKIANLISSDTFLSENCLKKEDSDEKKLLLFLSTSNASGLTLGDLKIFSPFTINVDPNFRRIIQEYFSKNVGALLSGGNRAGSITSFAGTLGNFGGSGAGGQAIGAIAATTQQSVARNSLADLSVDGVISMLRSIEGFNMTHMDRYAAAIRGNNINGKVLAAVSSSEKDLDEMKGVLDFSFGDWLLFKKVVLSGKLPSSSSTYLTLAPSSTHSNLREISGSQNNIDKISGIEQTSPHRNPGGQAGTSGVGQPSQLDLLKAKLLEKQVTLEETALASAIVVESPSSDSSTDPMSSKAGSSSGGGKSRRISTMSDTQVLMDPDEIEILYIGSSGGGHQTSASVISIPEMQSPVKETRPKPPTDLKIPSESLQLTIQPPSQPIQSGMATRNSYNEDANERTPLVSPSKYSVTSSNSNSSNSSPSSSSSGRRGKIPLERQQPLQQPTLGADGDTSSNVAKVETIL